MESIRSDSGVGVKSGLRSLSWVAVIVALFAACACGGGHKVPASTSQFPGSTADREQMERMLKFDARVQDYEISGDKLVVNVNDSWVRSPHGIKERAVGQWFNMFRSAQGNQSANVQVVVQFEGKEVAKWTPAGGYESSEAPSGSKSGEHAST